MRPVRASWGKKHRKHAYDRNVLDHVLVPAVYGTREPTVMKKEGVRPSMRGGGKEKNTIRPSSPAPQNVEKSRDSSTVRVPIDGDQEKSRCGKEYWPPSGGVGGEKNAERGKTF